MDANLRENVYKLLNSEAIQIIWDESLIGIAIVAPHGEILAANPKFQEYTGYSESELKRLRFQDFTHKDDVKDDEFLANQVSHGTRKKYHMNKRYIEKQGSIVPVHLKVVGVQNNLDEFVFFIAQVLKQPQRILPTHFWKALFIISWASYLIGIWSLSIIQGF